MTTKTATNEIKRTKIMQNRYALLYRINGNSGIFKYDRDGKSKPTLIEVSEATLEEIREGTFTNLDGLGLPKILESQLSDIATGAKLCEVFDQDNSSLTSENIMVLRFKPGSKLPSSVQLLSEY